MARRFFDHQQFNFEFQFALGGVHYGAGDLGEMLSTAVASSMVMPTVGARSGSLLADVSRH